MKQGDELMAALKIGDTVTVNVEWTEQEVNRMGIANTNRHKDAKGTVVYIHQKRRFYTVLFTFAGGSFRESFPCCGS